MAIQDDDLFLINRDLQSYNITARNLKIRMNNQNPDAEIRKPSIITPTNGAINTATKLIIESDSYILIQGLASHTSSDWKIIESGGDFDSPDFESLMNLDELTQWTTPDLNISTTYEVIVRYRASDGSESEWSDPVEFTTGSTVTTRELELINMLNQ